MNGPRCSIVVCTKNRPGLLRRCLAALTVLDYPSYELVIVDNTSGDPAAEREATSAGARYVVEPVAGLSRARNTGARVATSGLVAFTDDDALPDKSWLRHHTAALTDEAIAATTGRVRPWPPTSPVAQLYAAIGGEDVGPEPFRISRETPDWFERANFGGVGVGPNMVIRRAVFDNGWGFPEWLGPGAGLPGEEHYAFFSLIRRGYTIAYVPDALVHHESPDSLAALERRKRKILRGGSAYMTMMLVEEPEFRRETLRYMVRALSGRRRRWRGGAASAPYVKRGQMLSAAVLGPALYAADRLRRATTRESVIRRAI